MRKTLFSLALAMAVLSSCSSDDIVNNPMNEENHSFPASRSLHENILSFSSEEEYNALLDSLGTLSDEELLQWESGQKGFTSMYRMHSEALGQILNATCKEEYESAMYQMFSVLPCFFLQYLNSYIPSKKEPYLYDSFLFLQVPECRSLPFDA